MELRGRRKHYRDDDSDADDTSPRAARVSFDSTTPRPSTSANVHQSELAIAQRRASRAARGRKSHGDDSDGDDHEDALSEEKLQKQLRTVTDEKEIKRIKRLLRNRVSAQQARERKKQYVSELENKIADRDDTIKGLQREVKQAAAANATLRRLILTMRGPGHSSRGVVSRSAHAGAPQGERPPSADVRSQGSGHNDLAAVRQASGMLAPPPPTAHSGMSGSRAAQHAAVPNTGAAAVSLRHSVDSAHRLPSAHHSLRKLHGMPEESMQLPESEVLLGSALHKTSQDALDMSFNFGSSGDWPAVRAPV